MMVAIERSATRREVLRAGLFALGATTLRPAPADATPAMMREAIANIVGQAKITEGKVLLDIPPLVENGNTVPCTVTVESPMTPQDYVKAIHVVNEKNPQPNVVSVHLGPRAGKASIATRIRLSDTQTVIAIAQMSDGTFWSHRVNVIITLGACLENS